jgi:hypothetical protein
MDQKNKDTAYGSGGTGLGTGGRYDEKRDPQFPESVPTYIGHAAEDFDASRHASGSPEIAVTNTGVSNADVDEFTTGGNSMGQNAGVSRDNPPSVSRTVYDSGRRQD